ncbi:MAG: NAD(P)-binding domain-containing protein [Psychrobacter sp.]|uniref:NAD(P)-binding domain-containing protein n=1 Tax=Psychrobacter sp. AOP7-B1-24 TaxID=3457645 RepID=UPI003FB75ADE
MTKVTPLQKRQGYHITTSKGELEAKRIVVATGAFQVPSIPPIIPSIASVQQIHSDSYKNPEQLPEVAVLVIGSGSSGVQIAKELNAAGKKVYLSVGAHERPPQRYRGRDNVWWLGVLGGWDKEKPNDGQLKGFAVSGMNGGETVDFRKLAHDGIHLLGLPFLSGQESWFILGVWHDAGRITEHIAIKKNTTSTVSDTAYANTQCFYIIGSCLV